LPCIGIGTAGATDKGPGALLERERRQEPGANELHHLTTCDVIKHSTIDEGWKAENRGKGNRIWRRNNERMATLVSRGYTKHGIMLSVTLADETEASGNRAGILNSVLTSLGSRLRRAGLTLRVTAREFGEQKGRLHEHIWISGQLETLYTFAMEHWRGFKSYALEETWRDEGAKRSEVLQLLWITGQWRGKERPRSARCDHELIMGRYLAELAKIGYIDVLDVDTERAVGYVLSYVSKGRKTRGRISYSRSVSEAWSNATIGIRVKKGEIWWYMDLDTERSKHWRAEQIVRLERAMGKWSIEKLKEPHEIGWGDWLRQFGCVNGQWIS